MKSWFHRGVWILLLKNLRHTRCAGLVAGLLCVAVLSHAVADSAKGTATQFEEANKLYEQGKFAEAAASYDQLVNAGKVSAPLYFNLGNALFKSGQIGRAVLNYRLAETLAPRDPDIRANLRFAREAVGGGASAKPRRWHEWLERLTLNELTVMTAVAFWIWFALLIAGWLRPEWRRLFKGYTFTAGVGTLLLMVWLGMAAYSRFESQPAVVVVAEAVVRYGPVEESQSSFALHDGAEVSILDRKENWLQVQDFSGRTGWLRSDQVLVITPRPVAAAGAGANS